MNEVAQHLTRNVLPYQGIRQWVLSLPYSRRYRLAYDRALVGPVLDAFVRAIFSAHRRRVRTRHAVGRHLELAAAYRDKIVPTRNAHVTAESSRVPAVTRLSWAVLLRRTFAVDALACPRCGGRMRPRKRLNSQGPPAHSWRQAARPRGDLQTAFSDVP